MTIHFTKIPALAFASDSCSICLTLLHDENSTTSVVGHAPTSESQHLFHEPCAIEHLTQDQTCPLCREPVANYLELTSQEAIDTKHGEPLISLVEESDLHAVVTLLASREILAYHRGIATIEAAVRKYSCFREFTT